MTCCFILEYSRYENVVEDEGSRIGGRCVKVHEVKFSPNPNRIKPFICVPCKYIILSWIVEVVEWIDGACVFFCDIEDPLPSPPFCVPLESEFGGS